MDSQEKIPDSHPGAFVTLSYDDGRLNNYDIALKVHEEFGIPLSMAIIGGRTLDPGYWGRHMAPYQVADAHARGAEIVSHGMHHRTKFTELATTDLEFELREAKVVIGGILGSAFIPETLCVPFSRIDYPTLEQALDHYSLVRVHGGKLNDLYDSDQRLINSFGLTNETTFDQVKSWVDRAVQEKKWLVLMLHGIQSGETVPSKRYDISEAFLKEILSYIGSFDTKDLLPVTFRQAIAARKKKEVMVDFKEPEIRDPGPYELASSTGFKITYHKNSIPSDTVMITFGGLPSRISAKGFGSNFALAMGYDHIFVAQEAGSQYQKLSLDNFKSAVEPYIRGKKVVTYGSSLGAYAAIYYGGVVNAKIIAAAPKNSAHPSMRKRKFADVPFLHSEIKDNPKSGIPPLLIYDPYRSEETKFIKDVITPAYPGATHVTLPFAGHTVLNTMKESGVLKSFIVGYIENGNAAPPELRESDSYIWHAEKGRLALAENRTVEAIDHYEKSLELKDNAEAAGGYVKALLKTNRLEEARNFVAGYYERTGHLKGITKYMLKRLDLNGQFE